MRDGVNCSSDLRAVSFTVLHLPSPRGLTVMQWEERQNAGTDADPFPQTRQPHAGRGCRDRQGAVAGCVAGLWLPAVGGAVRIG